MIDDPDALPADDPAIDPTSQVLTVEADEDGGVTIAFGPQQQPDVEDKETGFSDNLADLLDEHTLSVMAQELLEGIEEDDDSRSAWKEDRKLAVDMLGIRIKRPEGSASQGKGISTITHPLLLEAVLRFQANARSELLPTDGPVKVRDDTRQKPASAVGQQPSPVPGLAGGGSAPGAGPVPSPGMGDNGGPPLDSGDMADALQNDFNHYLTTIATEFVPTTDEMLFWVGLGGIEFKKVYNCPIKRRPVSDWVNANDLIVSNNTIDIQSALRVTQVIQMRPSMIKRMQIAEAYRDVELGPASGGLDQVDNVNATAEAIGINSEQSSREVDRQHTIYECYCEWDIPGFEHKSEKGQITGLPLPYKVSIEKDSQTILEIRRNWREDDTDYYKAKQVFVPFKFVPMDGFYAIGLMHILGNTANAATANWRMMLDAGMLENFPGGLIADEAMRQDSINLMAGVGEFRKVKTGGLPIAQAVMPFPFKGPSAGLMQLQSDIVSTGSRVGGTAEIQVGEGKQDAPVGTTVALLEQAKIPLDAVHKRLHAAQAKEFELLVDLFREDPLSLIRGNKRAMMPGDETTIIQALEDHDLVPVADPNTSSQLQRQMRYQLLFQVAQAAPTYSNIPEIMEAIYTAAKLPDPQRFINYTPPPAGPQQDPAKMLGAQAQMLGAQAKAQQVALDAQAGQTDRSNNLAIQQIKSRDNAASLADQAADRESKEKLASLNLQRDMILHHNGQQADTARQVIGHVADHLAQDKDHMLQAGLVAHAGVADSLQQRAIHAHEAQQQAFAHGGAVEQMRIDHVHEAQKQIVDHYLGLREQAESHERAMEMMRAKPTPGLKQ